MLSRSWQNRAQIPVIRALPQLSDCDGELVGAVSFQQLLQPHQTLIILVDYGEGFPAPGFHQIHVRLEQVTIAPSQKPGLVSGALLAELRFSSVQGPERRIKVANGRPDRDVADVLVKGLRPDGISNYWLMVTSG